MCSISGFVSTTLACVRIQARSSVGVSPSYVAATRSGTSHWRNERSWSCASALVGNTNSVVSRLPSTTESTIGSW